MPLCIVTLASVLGSPAQVMEGSGEGGGDEQTEKWASLGSLDWVHKAAVSMDTDERLAHSTARRAQLFCHVESFSIKSLMKNIVCTVGLLCYSS